jgi:hypothetical protein
MITFIKIITLFVVLVNYSHGQDVNQSKKTIEDQKKQALISKIDYMETRNIRRIRIWNPKQISQLSREIDTYKSKNVNKIMFDFSGTTDKDLESFPIIPSVVNISICEEVKITDASLQIFARFPNLTILHLEQTGVTGKGFQYFSKNKIDLKQAPVLKNLEISDGILTDDGLREIAKIDSLKGLTITHVSGLTAKGIMEHLPKLKNLEYLILVVYDPKGIMKKKELSTLAEKMPYAEVRCNISSDKHERLKHVIGTGDPFNIILEDQPASDSKNKQKEDVKKK